MLLRGGEPSIRKMLSAYTGNLATAAAIRQVFGVSQDEFEHGYQEYLKRLTAGLQAIKQPPRAASPSWSRLITNAPTTPTRPPIWPTRSSAAGPAESAGPGRQGGEAAAQASAGDLRAGAAAAGRR